MRQSVRDIKEIVGILMRVTGGGDVSLDEVIALGFDAEDGLEDAVNEAYIKLLEFAHDREMRLNDSRRDHDVRSELKMSLMKIVKACSPV